MEKDSIETYLELEHKCIERGYYTELKPYLMKFRAALQAADRARTTLPTTADQAVAFKLMELNVNISAFIADEIRTYILTYKCNHVKVDELASAIFKRIMPSIVLLVTQPKK
jgi:hypothetical protein